MNNIKENSIHIPGGVVVCWPQYGGVNQNLDLSECRTKFNGCYAVNNSTVCFIVEGEIFVTPCTKEVMAAIKKAGLVEKEFFVPFSNWDYPKYEKTKWYELVSAAVRATREDFEADCESWCDEHGIAELSEETMQRCFRIPREGVSVKHLYFETRYYPATNEQAFDAVVSEKLGTYGVNNGKVAFVYRDGHTYVCKGCWIIDRLKAAGYKLSPLFVPFSNGEVITDPALAAEWEGKSK